MPGPFAIPSFIEYDDSIGSGFSAATASDDQVSSFSGGDDSGSNGDDIDSTYTTGTEFNVTPVNEPSVVNNVVDFFKNNTLAGSLISNIFDRPENQYAGITGEDGIGEGDYVSTLDDFAESRLGTDYASLDLEQQQFIDQEAFNAGYRSPSFQSLYNTGNLDNLQNLSQPESDAINQLVIQAPFAYGNQTPIESQVTKYFENLGNQQGLSTQLENDYNTAKTNVQNTLNITPLENQFGYSATPFGNTTTANLYANAFNVPYLQQRGLI